MVKSSSRGRQLPTKKPPAIATPPYRAAPNSTRQRLSKFPAANRHGRPNGAIFVDRDSAFGGCLKPPQIIGHFFGRMEHDVTGPLLGSGENENRHGN
jgi:hypothetical protein